jgi:hypothetical protein
MLPLARRAKMQDKYNIGVLAVTIELMWLGMKRMERFAKASPHEFYFTVNTPILYIFGHRITVFVTDNCNFQLTHR